MELSAAEIRTGSRRKRICGRFRAILAGLLELEVLRVRQKDMVEAALETRNSPDYSDDHEGRYDYWVEESLFKLKLKRSLSHENLRDGGNSRTFLDLRRTGFHRSSEDLQDFHRHECGDRQSRLSSGFCESHSDAMSSLSSSSASSHHWNTDSSAAYGHDLHTNTMWRSRLLNTKQKHVRNSDSITSAFSHVVIPEAGFLSVVDLYPDSHWPDISDILQPQVILEPCYRSDLRSHQGSEVYHYPSPLHAVALQSPLYAPQSPEHKRKSQRCSPGTVISCSSSLPRSAGQRRISDCTNFCPDSHTTMHSVMSLTSPAPLESLWCEEIILKRARGEVWSHSMAACLGITSWSRRTSASLHCTCSVGKRGTSSLKSVHFQKRTMGPSESGPPTPSQASAPGFRGRLGTHKNRVKRHSCFGQPEHFYRR